MAIAVTGLDERTARVAVLVEVEDDLEPTAVDLVPALVRCARFDGQLARCLRKFRQEFQDQTRELM